MMLEVRGRKMKIRSPARRKTPEETNNTSHQVALLDGNSLLNKLHSRRVCQRRLRPTRAAVFVPKQRGT
jgi:hypothetical protein